MSEEYEERRFECKECGTIFTLNWVNEEYRHIQDIVCSVCKSEYVEEYKLTSEVVYNPVTKSYYRIVKRTIAKKKKMPSLWDIIAGKEVKNDASGV